MTPEEQLWFDRKVYGMSVERQLEDGTVERIDPRTIRVVKEDNDKNYPIPMVRPEGYGDRSFETIIEIPK